MIKFSSYNDEYTAAYGIRYSRGFNKSSAIIINFGTYNLRIGL